MVAFKYTILFKFLGALFYFYSLNNALTINREPCIYTILNFSKIKYHLKSTLQTSSLSNCKYFGLSANNIVNEMIFNKTNCSCVKEKNMRIIEELLMKVKYSKKLEICKDNSNAVLVELNNIVNKISNCN